MIEVHNKEKRNYGIDFLRIYSMFLVVLLHSLGQGGLLYNLSMPDKQHNFVWILEIFAYCAVNIFGIISGYVGYKEKEDKVKYSNYFNLWLTVVFYGLIITLIFNIINPQIVTAKNYIKALLPVSFDLYWYFTAYTGLFILMPLINKAIRSCSVQFLKKLLILIFLVFSVFDTLTNNFDLSNGYSLIWLLLLYVIGAIIKKCNIGSKIKITHTFYGIILLCLCTFIYKKVGFELDSESLNITKNTLISYTSPTILGIAILYIIGLSKVKFNNSIKRIISFAAPASFSVYIINNHPLIWNYVMKDLFIDLYDKSILKIGLFTIMFSILFVVASILIDRIRIFIFKKLKIKKITEKFELILTKMINRFI